MSKSAVILTTARLWTSSSLVEKDSLETPCGREMDEHKMKSALYNIYTLHTYTILLYVFFGTKKYETPYC